MRRQGRGIELGDEAEIVVQKEEMEDVKAGEEEEEEKKKKQ